MACRLVVADDHERVRLALKVLLGLEADIEVVGDAANGEEAIQVVTELKPDVLLLDLTMPVMTGMEAIPHIRKASPDTRIVIVTMHRDADYMRKAFDAGAVGYVVKSTADEEVVGAVRDAFEGRTYTDASLAGGGVGGEGGAADPEEGDSEPGRVRQDPVLRQRFALAW
jgi:DNA-binding NarL/FixJ family response regulator